MLFLRTSFKPCTSAGDWLESLLSETVCCACIGRKPATEMERSGIEVRSRA